MTLSVASSKKQFNKLCGAAQFYLVLSLISVSMYLMNMLDRKKVNGQTASGLIVQLIVVFIWTYILNWVCTMKYGNKIAWFLVFLPLILVVTILIVVYHMMDTMDLNKEDLHYMLQKDEDEEGCSNCV